MWLFKNVTYKIFPLKWHYYYFRKFSEYTIIKPIFNKLWEGGEGTQALNKLLYFQKFSLKNEKVYFTAIQLIVKLIKCIQKNFALNNIQVRLNSRNKSFSLKCNFLEGFQNFFKSQTSTNLMRQIFLEFDSSRSNKDIFQNIKNT